MKSFILFLKAAMILFTTNSMSQSLIKCSGRLAYWAIPEDDFYYAVKLDGDVDLSTQSDILNVNEKALQYVLLDKQRYLHKDKDENDDLSILLRYTDGESRRLLNKYSVSSLEAGRELIALSSGKWAILWFFDLPEGKNKEVKTQFFANIVIGDSIFGLGVPLFKGEDFEATRVFLLNALDTVTKIKTPETLCSE